MKAQLLTPLRSIADDLVKKRLWPIAVLLLAALVAVPFVIGSGSSDAPAPAPVPAAKVAPAAQGAGSGSLVKVVGPAVTGKDDRPGKLDDPFYDPPAPPAAQTPSAAANQAPNSSGPATETPQVGPTPQVERKIPARYYRTEVRFYETERAKSRAISRLTPLGGLTDPAAVYLGVSTNGEYAVFLLGPNATSVGEAECDKVDECRIIGLKPGQSQVIDVRSPQGKTRQFHLDVVSLEHVKAGSHTAARKARGREHPTGRDVLRGMIEDRPTAKAIGPLRYVPRLGVIAAAARAAKPTP